MTDPHSSQPDPCRVYFAGELFSYKHLLGNAALAAEVDRVSEARFLPVLPQDLEFRSEDPHAIRDQDLLGLLSCDLALFQFDGQELDSGTVVEFLFAKFADIPAVVLRTDFRAAGDQGPERDPWNLMCSYYPRTKVIVKSALVYNTVVGHQRQELKEYGRETLLENARRQEASLTATARDLCTAFDSVSHEEPVLREHEAEHIYNYLARIPNFQVPLEAVQDVLSVALKRRQLRQDDKRKLAEERSKIEEAGS